MRYLIGSSFFDGGKNGPEFRRAFAPIWSAQFRTLEPTRIVIVSEAGSKRPLVGWNTDVIRLTGDCSHCETLVEDCEKGLGRHRNEFSGWSASMTALAMIAYCDMADFIYVEEDCLAFGDWVGQLYRDMGDGYMAFGRKMTSAPWMPCSQSMFIVRHVFIPEFVSSYLALGGERNRHNLGEAKFCKLEKKSGTGVIRRLTFGVDRERPIPWDAPVWFAQQWTPAELAEARARNLIP